MKGIQVKEGETHDYNKYRRARFLIILVISVYGVLGQGYECSAKSTNGTKNVANSTSKITKANFDKINVSETNGDSKEEIEKSFGQKPDSTTTLKIKGRHEDMQTFNKVKGEKPSSRVTIGFSNGHVISKSITGLKTERTKKINMFDFNKIQHRMSRNDIKNRIGKPDGVKITKLSGRTTEIWDYTRNLKGAKGASLQVTFTNGEVTRISEKLMRYF